MLDSAYPVPLTIHGRLLCRVAAWLLPVESRAVVPEPALNFHHAMGLGKLEVDTVAAEVAVSEPKVAVMVAVPFATAVTRPDALTVETAEAEELQVTEEVTVCVVPLL